MGFDVSGLNPQRNKTTDEFPILDKWNNVSWQVREESKEWKKEEDKYWKEWDELNNLNPGVYFRNNVWWWRPLWNYCYKVCEDILTEEDWEQGSWNDGHEYSEEACIEMATRLQEEIDNGHCKAYEDSYKKWQAELPKEPCSRCNGNNRGNNKKKECNICDKTGEQEDWNASYPFNVENVQNFVNFLKECGGMSIC